jgi:hypothetical protein
MTVPHREPVNSALKTRYDQTILVLAYRRPIVAPIWLPNVRDRQGLWYRHRFLRVIGVSPPSGKRSIFDE